MTWQLNLSPGRYFLEARVAWDDEYAIYTFWIGVRPREAFVPRGSAPLAEWLILDGERLVQARLENYCWMDEGGQRVCKSPFARPSKVRFPCSCSSLWTANQGTASFLGPRRSIRSSSVPHWGRTATESD